MALGRHRTSVRVPSNHGVPSPSTAKRQLVIFLWVCVPIPTVPRTRKWKTHGGWQRLFKEQLIYEQSAARTACERSRPGGWSTTTVAPSRPSEEARFDSAVPAPMFAAMSAMNEPRRRVRIAQSLPRFDPCLPRPALQPPMGPGWIHDIKHDGFRILAHRRGRVVPLFSRNGLNFGTGSR